VERDSLMANRIIVMDLGGYGSHVAAREVRKLQVYSEIFPIQASLAEVLEEGARGVILTGKQDGNLAGREEVYSAVRKLLEAGIPVLAVGSGFDWLVERAEEQRAAGLVTVFPGGIESLAEPSGKEVLEDFVGSVCRCEPTWTMEAFVESSIQRIRSEVGSELVVCGLSGGVDSAVAAALVHQAVGSQLTCIFVDHGFMRKYEAETVADIFRRRFGKSFIAVDAKERFFAQVKGVTDPEEKRKRIGGEFIRVFEEEAAKLGKVRYLVQGTVYPDVVESGAGQGALVKSHHNVGGLPEKMDFRLLEPLRWLFKDEVRKVGQILGLPDELVWRQPFPGPGLAVRVIGEVTPAKVAVLQDADYILRDEIKKAGLERDIWQYFAVLTDTRAVGVQDQRRTYGYVLAIRAVNSVDGMTASWVQLPYHVLEKISSRIMGEVKEITRVVYDISSKPPATIEWE